MINLESLLAPSLFVTVRTVMLTPELNSGRPGPEQTATTPPVNGVTTTTPPELPDLPEEPPATTEEPPATAEVPPIITFPPDIADPPITAAPERRVRFIENNLPEPPSTIKDLLLEAYNQDKVVQSILEALDKNASRHPEITLADCERRGNYLTLPIRPSPLLLKQESDSSRTTCPNHHLRPRIYCWKPTTTPPELPDLPEEPPATAEVPPIITVPPDIADPPITAAPETRVRFIENNLPEPPSTIKDLLLEAYNQDKVVQSILEALDKNASRHPEITLADCERRGNYLYYRNRLYVPDNDELKAEILRLCHDKPTVGHPGRSKTYELLSREYYWPRVYHRGRPSDQDEALHTLQGNLQR
ncbi:hypothetical protein PDIG_24190 [Penicillium digitatum PHI26]|uniref:Integrase zinc-binding domain-containing protein n=1 Tax=Penicillium digitatum (strain PHI26 / CECT 20796) TaxID=1170229 RepID=K9G486_PEND2|nr:hypothetical protein PDIG_24190 [Penicillium digitatum PHI26]